MMFFAITAVLALTSLAAIPARAATFNVTVGGPGVLRYDPESVNANVGDTIIFTFKQKNHTVTQSSFGAPCAFSPGGFDSGFRPVADNATEGFPTSVLTVENTNPVWVYCKQTGHCQQGMVFAVNPGDKFAAFQAAANASGAANTTSSAAATSTPSVVTVTATVTANGGSVVTTTYGSYPGSAQPTSAQPVNHQVVVGGVNKLTFDPANITAQPGDTISFQFMVKNHTVTQSSFAAPCRALSATSASGQTGFDSGFMPVAANATSFPTFTVTVNDTTPVWAYCRQAGHCGQGMVFAVNAIESGPNNFGAFQALARQLNGTSASSTATSSGSSSTNTSAAMSAYASRSAGVALVLAGLVFGLLM
ncbi:Cupredoxin [Phellopilus nigrolimitatus]|nr:Cupredoxin [Phellopilus nigrolimitatus]